MYSTGLNNQNKFFVLSFFFFFFFWGGGGGEGGVIIVWANMGTMREYYSDPFFKVFSAATCWIQEMDSG